MAELTNLESKLGEVVGLAMAAQEAGQKVARLAEGRRQRRARRHPRAHARGSQGDGEARHRGRRRRSTARRRPSSTRPARSKQKAQQMMKTYLDQASDSLDGFEFLTMAEAGEVGHWEILGTLNDRAAKERSLRARLLGAADPAAALRDRPQGVARAGVGGGSERDLVVGDGPGSPPPRSQPPCSRAVAAATIRSSHATTPPH